MLRASLLLLLAAVVCLFFADMGISHGDPWLELARMSDGLIRPDFGILGSQWQALANTVAFALCSVFLSVMLGALGSFYFAHRPVRWLCAVLRSIHEIFWAFLFLPLLGLNPICGVLAITVPYSGIFAKVFAEIYQEADHKPLAALPVGTGRITRFFYGVLPTVYEPVKHYISYRFECGLRSAAVLGFIGLPTLGYHLETSFREGIYTEAAGLLYVFFVLVALLRVVGKPKLVPIYVVAAFWYLPKTLTFSWANATRFLTHDILPWPMRRKGFNDGTDGVEWWPEGLGDWFQTVLVEQVWPGIWNTVILSQMALAASGLVTLVFVFFLCRHCQPRWMRWLAHGKAIVGRTTPEYILAYVFVQLLGPSMLPAVMAISVHNGSIMGFLSAHYGDRIQLRQDAPKRRLDRYFFEVLPRIYGHFLAFLFYRWETILRESAILGLLGIATLGFYIDSAFADDRMDVALILILATAGLNLCVDHLSQWVRARLRISHNPARI